MTSVAVTKITVASTDVRLRVSISVVDPVVNTTTVVPVSQVSYIYLQLFASLDTTGRFRYVADLFALIDGKVFSFEKSLSHSAGITDAKLIDASLAKSETITMSDFLQTLLIFIRNFQDTTSLSESIAKTLNNGISDTVQGIESIAFTINKHLADSFSLNDLSDVNGTTISFADYTNNVVSLADAKFLGSSKSISDTVSLADSGFLFSQSYCDITYFLEDYVGQYRTF